MSGTTNEKSDWKVKGALAPPIVTVTRLMTGEAPCDWCVGAQTGSIAWHTLTMLNVSPGTSVGPVHPGLPCTTMHCTPLMEVGAPGSLTDR